MADTVNDNSWKCHGAFIIFNHEESYRRCLNDYSTFKGLVQPAALRFKGTHILDVRYAQEPGNILWENLEISPKQRSQVIYRVFNVGRQATSTKKYSVSDMSVPLYALHKTVLHSHVLAAGMH
eukprot:7769-Heterococcus_DN1.PRE.5